MKNIKSRERVVNHGEVFTSEKIINSMLELIKQESVRIDSRFLEPACGNGNFLYIILKEKFKNVELVYKKNKFDYDKYMIIAVSSIYGVELLQDNVYECQERLLNLFLKEYKSVIRNEPSEDLRKSVEYILNRNILCGDALTLLNNDGNPIIFSEWSIVHNRYIKRRDFKLSEMLMFPPIYEDDTRLNLMGDLLNDVSIDNSVIRVFQDFKPIEFEKVHNYENASK